jgi:DNA polymerase III delta prime subunit
MSAYLKVAQALAKEHTLPIFALQKITTHKNANGVFKKDLKFYYSDEKDTSWGFKNSDFTNGKVIRRSRNDNVFAVKTGLLSRVIVIDFDDEASYHRLINAYTADIEGNPYSQLFEVRDTLTVKTRKGYHVYLRISEEHEMLANSTGVFNAPIDIRGEGGCIICPPSHYTIEEETHEYEVFNDVPIATMSTDLYELLTSDTEHVKIYGKTYKPQFEGSDLIAGTTDYKPKHSFEELQEHVSLFPRHCVENYDIWFRIGASIATETNKSEEGFNLFMEFSRSSPLYADTLDDVYSKKWSEYDGHSCTIGTIIYYLRQNDIPIPMFERIFNVWMGVDIDEPKEAPRFDSLKMIKMGVKRTPEIQAIFDIPSKTRTEEQKAQLTIFHKKDYIIKRKYFEEFHFRDRETSRYVRVKQNGDLTFMNNQCFKVNTGEIKASDGKAFSDKWTSDPYMRTFDKTDFYPPPSVVPSHVYNTFTPFAITNTTETDDTNISVIFEHMSILTGRDDVATKYLCNWLAHLVQKPGVIPGVALVFTGKQGTGKNLFFECLAETILGSRYWLQTSEMEKITGRFPMIKEKLMVIMDETKGKDSFDNSETLKNLITSPKIQVEKKGIDGMTINNYSRFVFLTNNDTPVKIEASDRRFVVYKSDDSHLGKSDYFKKLAQVMKDPVQMKAFYDILMSADITDFDLIYDRPKTEIYLDIQRSTIPAHMLFLDEWITSNDPSLTSDEATEHGRTLEVKASNFYKVFTSWCEDNCIAVKNGKCTISSTRFGLNIKNTPGITKEKKRTGAYYTIDIEEVVKNISV